MKPDDSSNPEGDLFDIPDDPIERPAPPAMQLIGDWMALAAIMALLGYIDYLTGYKISLFVFYFIPIIIGTRRLGLLSGILLSVVSVIMRDMADYLDGRPYASEWIAVWNTFMRLASFLTVTWLTAHYTLLLARYRTLAATRRKLAAEVKVLEGLLPICTSCKKICNDQGNWEPVEHYIEHHTEAKFAHDTCPECRKKWSVAAGMGGKPDAGR